MTGSVVGACIHLEGALRLIKKLFGKTKLYLAVAHAYDDYARKKMMRPESGRFRSIGEHSVIEPDVHVTHPGRVWIGDHSLLQGGVYVNSVGGVHIGNYVGVGRGTVIVTFTHSYRNAKTIPFDERIFLKPVLLRDFVWIAWNCRIMPGVEIGEGAILSMGSVVTENVPPLAIVMGNPAKVIGYRSQEHFESCKSEGRVNSARILATYGKFDEKIPIVTQKRYAKELRELGMIPPETGEPGSGG